MTDTPSSRRYLVQYADGTEIGPFDKRVIQAMAKSGRLKAEDSISQEGTGKWIAAGKVPGLLPPTPKMSEDGPIPLADPQPIPPVVRKSEPVDLPKETQSAPTQTLNGSPSFNRKNLVAIAVVGLGAVLVLVMAIGNRRHEAPAALPTPQAVAVDPVVSFKSFAQCFRSQLVSSVMNREAEIASKNHSPPKEALYDIKTMGYDVVHTDSLANPVVGVITIELIDGFAWYNVTFKFVPDQSGHWTPDSYAVKWSGKGENPHNQWALEKVEYTMKEIDLSACK